MNCSGGVPAAPESEGVNAVRRQGRCRYSQKINPFLKPGSADTSNAPE